MNRAELEVLYKQIIQPESKNPYHFRSSENSSDQVKAYNPMCGDKFHLHLEMNDNISEVGYSGMGCAISKASTSLLLQKIEGLNLEQARKLCVEFLLALDSGDFSHFQGDDKILTLLELRNFEGRLDCIQLSWKALEEYITNK